MRKGPMGSPFIGKSVELQIAEERLTLHLKQAAIKCGRKNPITEDISAKFLFYFPEKDYRCQGKVRNGERKLTLPDLSNLLELPQDCLTAAGIIGDDGQICSLDGSRRLISSDSNARLEVFLYPFDDKSGG